jgi:copper transport protein
VRVQATAPLFAMLLSLIAPGVILAHAYPVGSSPAANAVLAQAPSSVQVWFTERLEPRLSTVEVVDAQRQSVQNGAARVDPGNPRELVASLRPQLPNGAYTVVWHVVSADDGHATAGAFAFGVGEAVQTPATPPANLASNMDQPPTVVAVLARWLTYLGTVLILGTSALVLFVARHDGHALGRKDPATTSSPMGLIGVGLGILLVGQLLALADEWALASATAPSADASPAGVSQMVFATRFGTLWLGRSALLIVEAAVMIWCRADLRRPWNAASLGGRRPGTASVVFWIASLAAGLALVTDLTASGHAAAGSPLAYDRLIQATLPWARASAWYLPVAARLVAGARAITFVIDWLHLFAVSVWVGGVLALVVTTWGSARSGEAGVVPGGIRPTVGRFSRVALLAAGVVILTGLYNTWLYLAGPSSYVTTSYGQSLLVKHVAIVALLLAAATNRSVTVPLLAEGKSPSGVPSTIARRLVRRPLLGLRAEAVLGVLVLLSTGVLTTEAYARSPGQILRDPARELALATTPFRATLALGKARVATLVLSPGSAGPNEYDVAVDRDGVPARDVERAYLEFTPLDATGSAPDLVQLAPADDGHFRQRGLALAANGPWQVGLRVYWNDGTIDAASVVLQATERGSAQYEIRAHDLLAKADEAMGRLRSARMVEALDDGAGGLSLADYTFVAPDREAIVNPVGTSVIQIGTTTYVRDRDARAWRAETGATGTRWPDGAYGQLADGIGAIVVGEDRVLGQPCTIVAFYSPRVSGIYEEWIGNDDHLIHEEVMAAPSHYMVNLYADFDGPERVEPPNGVAK